MGNPVVHWEFWSKDPGKVADFYKKVFDWEIQHIPEMDYRMVKAGEGGIGGGIMKPQDGPIPAPVSFYIGVDDLDSYGRKITSAGGTLMVEKQEVPGMGAFSLFSDPEGRVLGIWKQA